MTIVETRVEVPLVVSAKGKKKKKKKKKKQKKGKKERKKEKKRKERKKSYLLKNMRFSREMVQ